MNIQERNNVHLSGSGQTTIVFAHGFGCDQTMWRLLTPAYQERYKIITFDLVGSGASDCSAYDRQKYESLHGYADDLIEIIDAFSANPVIFIGHSVSATIGMLASIKAPSRFMSQVMVGPSPCFINQGSYIGGFSREDIDDLLETMEGNYLGWAGNMAPAIMGAPGQPELGLELTDSFCRSDPEIAKHFARATFLSDHRADVAKCPTPTLILQSADDIIAPIQVGEFMHHHLQRSVLRIIDNVGHCPHMSAPTASTAAIDEFLARPVA
jgi:sigma-B regulation protein RsbQ